MENAATLGELETLWNLDDVARANALLDMRADLDSEAMRRQEGRNG